MPPKQKTLFSMPHFTRLSPQQKRSKKRQAVELNEEAGEIELVNVAEIEEEVLKEQRRQAWNEAWTATFEWACFDRDVARIFCMYCKKDSRCKSEFGRSGSINIQHNALTEHAKTRAHMDAKYIQGKNKQTIEDGMNRSSDVADQATLNLFAAAYHVGKDDLSFSKFSAVLSLLRFCKCPYMTLDLYHNDKACATFVYYISEALLQDVVKKIRASGYYSLMMDESTDIGHIQHLIVYASFMVDYEPTTAFLGLLEIQGGTSSHLHDSSKYFLSHLGLASENLVCLGTDGASAMLGRVNGLAARLKRNSPYMTAIHCIAHRASLCLADAVKASVYAQEIDLIVNEISGTFSRSPQRTQELKSLEEELGCAQLHMSRIHSIRWLSRSVAVHKVCESMEPLLVFLKTHNPNLFVRLSSFQMIYSLHFMADILERLAILSKTFQSTFVDVSSVVGVIETEIRLIRMQFIEEPFMDMNASTFDSKGYHVVPEYGPLGGQLAALRASLHGNTYRSVKLDRRNDGTDLEKAVEFQKEFCELVIRNLIDRFPDKELVGCFKVLAPCSFLKGREVKNYGSIELETLAAHYGEGKFLENGEEVDPWIDKVQLKKEFQYFKAQAPYEWEARSLRDTWVSIGRNPTVAAKYPMLLKLAQYSMLQCASTAACERGFSIQNIIKSKLRNSLTTRSMDALMRVSIEGPTLEEFDFSAAIHMWKTSAKTSRHIYGEHTRVHGVQRG